MHVQNLPHELQAHHICIDVGDVREGRWMQRKDFELKEECLDRPGYVVGNRKMLVRRRDNNLVLMWPELDTKNSRSKSKLIDMLQTQLYNGRTTSSVRTSPISLVCPGFLHSWPVRGYHKAAYMQ